MFVCFFEASEKNEKAKDKAQERERDRLLLRQICKVSRRHPRACNEGPAVREVLCVPECTHAHTWIYKHNQCNICHSHKMWQNKGRLQRKREQVRLKGNILWCKLSGVARWQLNDTTRKTHKPNLSLFPSVKASRDFRKPRVKKKKQGSQTGFLHCYIMHTLWQGC